jgi:uncharacterized protein (TIGR02996 family)
MAKGKRAARAAKGAIKEPAPKKVKRASVPGAALTYARDAGLEAAIIDAPLDPVPRMVYADWIQAAGDRRGEWMALHAAIEREPNNVRLRSLAVDFLGANAELLLGAGKKLLAGAWIGWRSGFIDEIRVQPFENQRAAVASFAGLLAHPSARFVRTVGIGSLGQEAIDVLAQAAPPLLETVVATDAPFVSDHVELDGIAALPTIRRLGLNRADLDRELPLLVEVGCAMGNHVDWIAAGGCPNLERLTIDCVHLREPKVASMLRAVPKLTQLRVLHLDSLDSVLDAILNLRGLEVLDVSHSGITEVTAARLLGWRGTLVALRTELSSEIQARLVREGTSVVASAGRGRMIDDHKAPGGWLHHRLATDGRDGLATLPGIGNTLYNVGTHHSIYGNAVDAVPLLDASLTYPSEDLKTWAWANAAIAHERVHQFDDAELIAREGMLRTPKEPNLYAIVVDALRRTGRLDEALALVPRSLAAVEAPPGPGAHSGGRGACLADVMLVLAQAGRHTDVLELRDDWNELCDQRTDMHAIAAMSEVAIGKVSDARTSLAKAKECRFEGVLAHARAVVALAAKKPNLDKALAHLAECKDARYPEWHWIATDPNLAKLRDLPAFRELV